MKTLEKLAIDGGTPAVTRRTPQPPRFDEREKQALCDVLDTGNVFRYLRDDDSQVRRFEERFAERIGTRHCLAVNSGTSALMCGLVGLGIGPGDEVILPGYTFIASAAAVLGVGAVPVIAEVDDSLTLDPEDFERKITPSTAAVMPVHMRGTPCQMREILAIAERRGLKVIEDVAQACGGSYGGRRLGSWGDVGCFSLQHFKIITVGEGGAVVTDSDEVIGRANMYHDCGRPFWEGYEGEVIPGLGFRMSELAGALGCVQVEKLDAILARHRANKARIVAGIQGLPGVTLQRVPDPEGDCAISLVLFLPDAEAAKRFANALRAEGVGCGTVFDNTIPDRHIYTYWDHILEKKGYTPAGSPWTHPAYKGSVSYSKDMCPRTLDYLGRSVALGIPQYMDPQEAAQWAEAIRKVAHALAG